MLGDVNTKPCACIHDYGLCISTDVCEVTDVLHVCVAARPGKNALIKIDAIHTSHMGELLLLLTDADHIDDPSWGILTQTRWWGG